jgi:hypothetical protein
VLTTCTRYVLSGEYIARFNLTTTDEIKGEPEFLDVWNEAYASVMSHVRATDGYSVRCPSLWVPSLIQHPQYRTVTLLTGLVASSNVDSLSAFWAGLQVLAGDVQNAIKSHLFCTPLQCHGLFR